MDIGEAAKGVKPIALTRVEGVHVRNLTDAEYEGIFEDVDEEMDDWGVILLKLKALTCDGNGDPLEGLGSVEELKSKISKGTARDILVEAEEVLILGKSLMARHKGLLAKQPST